MGSRPTARRRVLRALGVLIVSAIVWIAIPYYVGTYAARAIPSFQLSDLTFDIEFGGTLTALAVLGVLLEGRAAWVPVTMASNLVIAYYLWVSTNGGYLSVTSQGTTVVLSFQLLVILMITPSLWGAVRTPLAFWMQRRADRAQGPPVTATPVSA